MEERTNKRKTIILLIVGTIALIGVVVGATFAYFAAQVGTGDKAALNAKAGTTDSLTFDKGKDIFINANQSNFYENAGDLKDSTTLSAHLVAGDDDNDAHYKYNIYLDIASNNFEYTSGSEPELVLLVQDPEGTYLEEIPGLTKSNITIDDESHPCFDITTQSGLITIQEDYLIDAIPQTQGKADHTWNITVVFKNLPTDQNNNTSKSFNAKITIQSEKMNFLVINSGVLQSGKSSSDYSFYRESTYRNQIKNVYFVNKIDTEKLNSVQSYDLSSEKDESIMAWLVEENEESATPYNLYIGSNEKIMVRDFSSAFSNMYNLEIVDFGENILDTTYMNNMSYMFNYYQTTSDGPVPKLKEIKGLDKFDTHNVVDMSYMFTSASSLTDLDLSNWKTNNVTDMSYIFYDVFRLTSIGDVNNWDTSKVTNMSNMFSGVGLTTLNLSNWNTHNVTNMSSMFSLSSLITLNLSTWDTSNVTDMSYMFSTVINITTLDLSGWDTHNVTNMTRMFHDTRSLTSIDLRKAIFSQATSFSEMFGSTNSELKVTVTGEANKEWFIKNAGTMYGNIGLTAEQLENQLIVLPE